MNIAVRKDDLTLAEARELENFADGQITQQMVAHVIAQRGQPGFVPTVADHFSRLKFIRAELARQSRKVTEQRIRLVNAVADHDVAPTHDKDRCARLCAGIRKTLESYEAEQSALITDEAACEDAIASIAAEAQELLAAE